MNDITSCWYTDDSVCQAPSQETDGSPPIPPGYWAVKFNVRGQLKRLKAAHSNPGIDGVDVEYAYSTQDVANNGRLRTQHDHITDELLYFDYDELNRLRAAETIDAVTPEGLRWGRRFQRGRQV